MSMYGVFDVEEEVIVGMRSGQDRDVPGVICGKSMAKQEFRDECDINHLMKGYEKGKALTHFAKHEGRFEDVADAPGYHEACNLMLKAQEMFNDLPALVRDRFANDPERFLEFVHNPDNKGELVTMGLAKAPEPEPGPQAVRIVQDEPKGGEAK